MSCVEINQVLLLVKLKWDQKGKMFSKLYIVWIKYTFSTNQLTKKPYVILIQLNYNNNNNK